MSDKIDMTPENLRIAARDAGPMAPQWLIDALLDLADIKERGIVDDASDTHILAQQQAQINELTAENERLKALINAPELDNFLRAVHIEAVHQVERWGTAHDRAKRPADWFWLVGYLAGKALHSAVSPDTDKARHHCVSTAAALYNWHCSIKGVDVSMCPGRSDLAEMVDKEFPGEVTL